MVSVLINSMSDLNSILDGLSKLNEEDTQTFKLPHSKIEVELKPFQSKHSSMVNSSLMAGSDGTYGLKFSSLLKEVFDDVLTMKGNTTYGDISIPDVYYLVLKLRESFNDEIFANVGEGNQVGVPIKKVIKGFEGAKYSKESTITVGDEKCSIEVKLPSFSDDNRYDRILVASHEKFSETNKEKMIEDVFAFTMLKFVKTIKMVVKNDEMVLEMDSLSPLEQKRVMGMVPNKIHKMVQNAIEDLTRPITDLLKVGDGEQVITIDQSVLVDA